MYLIMLKVQHVKMGDLLITCCNQMGGHISPEQLLTAANCSCC